MDLPGYPASGRAARSSPTSAARSTSPPEGSSCVHAYSGVEAAGYAAEGATIVTVAVDDVSLGEAVTRQLTVDRSGPDRR